MSMIKKYHNLTPQTNPSHREKEPHDTDCNKTVKQSNQLSLPQQVDCKTRRTQSTEYQKKDYTQNPHKHNWSNSKQKNQRLRTKSNLNHWWGGGA